MITGAGNFFEDFRAGRGQSQQHDRQAVDATDSRSVTCGDCIEPTAASRAAGHCAVLVADVANVLADFIVQFRGEGASTDAVIAAYNANPNIVVYDGHGNRTGMTEQEVRTFHGVIKFLSKHKHED